MKFDAGIIEVSGLRRVVFGERGQRQHIYERKGDVWFEVAEFDGAEIHGPIADSFVVRAVKGAACNKRSRVVINGDTVNIGKPKEVKSSQRTLGERWLRTWFVPFDVDESDIDENEDVGEDDLYDGEDPDAEIFTAYPRRSVYR